MTAIACYFQREHDVVYPWAVADSRVSQGDGAGDFRPYHDHAIKVFSIPFQVKAGAAPQAALLYRGSFGFCYSGSSLTGLNAQAAFSHLLRNLVSNNGQPPKLREIVDYIASVLRQYVHARKDLRAACECAVLGRCPVEGVQKIFLIRPTTQTVDGLFGFDIETLESDVEAGVALLGDEKKEVQKLIDAARARATVNSINWFRAPWHGINDAIQSKKFGTIGGHIQLGIGVGSEFLVLARSEQLDGEKLREYPEFLGLTLSDELKVGPCALAIPRMGGLRSFSSDEYP
jgi:hypothetical protein